jgi:glycosyltransferase involved in cell wall biosynthesis
MSDSTQRASFVTIGIVALNRAWIIDQVFSSILSQTYHHDCLFVLFVDGESRDGTAEIAKKRLLQSDFKGYEVIVQKCSIPEGRNICLERMRGDLLLFWDSDVIMPPDAVSKLVEALETERADLITATVKNVTVSSTSEIPERLYDAKSFEQAEPCTKIKAASMGQTILSKTILTSLSFDPDFTVAEDCDFGMRASARGYKLMSCPSVVVLDVNMNRMAYSDIHIDMPVKWALRGIRKKAKAQIYFYNFASGWKSSINFFLEKRRYLFYWGHLLTILLSIYGILVQNLYLFLLFPVYALLYAGVQIERRGLAKGLKAFIRSVVVGIPDAFWVAYYFLKYISKRSTKSEY